MGYGKERPCKKCGEVKLIQALGLCQQCFYAEKILGTLDDNYPAKTVNPKIRLWAVIEPSDNHIVATHQKREFAEGLVHGKRYLVELTGNLKGK